MEAIKVLQNKVKGTVLFDSVLGENVLFERLEGNRIICSNNNKEQTYKGNGKLFDNTDAIVVLTPSRKMRDWSKFAWKKGDILLCEENKLCIFDKWANEDYTEIEVKYAMPGYENAEFKTSSCYKETNEFVIKKYVSLIELTKGGKLNLSTLQIEKQPEFKDGDIIIIKDKYVRDIAIFKEFKDHGNKLSTYVQISPRQHNHICYDIIPFKLGLAEVFPATDSEKQQLFDALAKEGKRWNPDAKQIEDLPKKCEFEPFDKVLVRDNDEDSVWSAAFFSHKDGKYFATTDTHGWQQCIPYNEETKHLLGTADEWKGGEG